MTLEVTSPNGETESFPLTRDELTAWESYADTHPHLLARMPYGAVLRMFLTNYRMSPTFFEVPAQATRLA